MMENGLENGCRKNYYGLRLNTLITKGMLGKDEVANVEQKKEERVMGQFVRIMSLIWVNRPEKQNLPDKNE